MLSEVEADLDFVLVTSGLYRLVVIVAPWVWGQRFSLISATVTVFTPREIDADVGVLDKLNIGIRNQMS